MSTIFVGLLVFSLSLVYSNGQRRQSDWGSPRFGQGNFGDERGIGRGMFGGFRPNQMGPDFGQGGRGGIDRDLFGSRDPNEMGQGGGIGRGQPRDPQQGEVPTPVQPPIGQTPEIGQGEMPGQPQIPEGPDQLAQEQGMGQTGQPQLPGTPDPRQFLGRGQGEIPVPTQPSMTESPGEIGQGFPPPSRPPVPTQGQPPMRQSPDLRAMGQNGGIGRGGGRREIPMPQQPPMSINPNQMGPGDQTTLGGPVQNELPSEGPPTMNPNSAQVGRPQTPPQSVGPGQTQPSQRRSEFGDRDIDELAERVSRPPRGK